MYRYILFFLIGLFTTAQAQEFNATVFIDADQTGQPNFQVFRTLKTQLTEFINTTNWTDKEFKTQERISANFTLIISAFDGDEFTASMQIQAARPVFGSTYSTPIYNFNDKSTNFTYKEFQNLNFNINNFDSNLISVIAFHIYNILGLDADTFKQDGGDEYFETSKQIVSTASTSNFVGWKATEGLTSRFRYNDALISTVYKEFHTAMYKYHREGMDLMHKDKKQGKEGLVEAIAILKKINDRRPNSYLVRTFFDAKANEIKSAFTGGPKVDITTLIENLNRLSPSKRAIWAEIKF